jgi:hypothetical protein
MRSPHHHTRPLPELTRVLSLNTPREAHSFIHSFIHSLHQQKEERLRLPKQLRHTPPPAAQHRRVALDSTPVICCTTAAAAARKQILKARTCQHRNNVEVAAVLLRNQHSMHPRKLTCNQPRPMKQQHKSPGRQAQNSSIDGLRSSLVAVCCADHSSNCSIPQKLTCNQPRLIDRGGSGSVLLQF